MTREEAVEALTRLEISNFRTRSGKSYISEALVMAIDALRTEPCEDCISRSELLKAIDTWDKFGFEHTGCFVREPKDDFVTYVHYDDVVKCIKGMPSVQPTACIAKISFDDQQMKEMIDKAISNLELPKTEKWIPVSERLPEENEEVLVTFKSDDEIRVYNCKYFDNSPWWKNYVIAWMPLPEPWEEDEE